MGQKNGPVGDLFKVTAAVIEREGRVLVARRRKGDRFGGLWEFPGGKLEPGEEPEEGLERELVEELGVRSRVGAFVCSVPFRSPVLNIELLVYRVELLSDDLRPQDHDETRWLAPGEMVESDFSEPDRPVVRLLAAETGGPERAGR